MNHSGLKDKNGFEICEGHKVRGCGTIRDYLSPVHQIVRLDEKGKFFVGDNPLDDFITGNKFTSLEIVS